MVQELFIQEGVSIPLHEVEITTSRAGGAGGQHVNKTDSRITLRWNITTTSALTETQKAYVLQKLSASITNDGDIIIHSSSSRSQPQNKEAAFKRLVITIRKALFIPKKRIATRVSKGAKESRLKSKTHQGLIKKMRAKKIQDD